MKNVKEYLAKTPYFEHPSWFTEPVLDEKGRVIKPAQNFYYKNGNRNVGEGRVFMVEEDYVAENDIFFEQGLEFCLVFEENGDNFYNRQYLKSSNDKFYDSPLVWDISVGDRYTGGKIVELFTFTEFTAYLSANKHNKVLKQLLTKIED